MEIYLIRHTTPLIETSVCYGQSDISVNENFDTESGNVLNMLPSEIDALYSSPLQRCTMLAEKIISSNKTNHYQSDARLIEINFGDWEMKKWDDIDRIEFDKWAADFVNQKIPNGESFTNLNTRVNKFINDLLQHNYKTVAIVTHSGVIRCFLSRFNNIPLDETMNIEVGFSSLHILKTL
jgi:alpha-ribazole phosphatase